MYVVATAGHVDHGKSALVRALTGMEPDRWAEEQRRGMTIDLGFAWSAFDDVGDVAFVDVPGHERFVTNMLAGIGPVPAVLVVVAADEGWQPQTEEHAAVLDGFGVQHGLLVVTKADLADANPVRGDALERLEATSLRGLDSVVVSARTGAGLAELRAALARLLRHLPAPDVQAPVRLWVDRAFTIRGVGTVVTGTLPAGRIAVGDELCLQPDGRHVVVRGLQSRKEQVASVEGTARVAVSLRGVDRDDVGRGMALTTPEAWTPASTFDVRTGADAGAGQLVVHVGAAAVPARVRRLGPRVARVRLDSAVPLHLNDRVLLRDPSRRTVVGADVAELDPVELRRRGDAARVAATLSRVPTADDVVDRRGVVAAATLPAWGLPAQPTTARRVGDWWVSAQRWEEIRSAVRSAAADRTDSFGRGVPLDQLRRQLDLPDLSLATAAVATVDDVELVDGQVRLRGAVTDESVELTELRRRLTTAPLDAPDADQVRTYDRAVLAHGVRSGALLHLGGGVYVGPQAPEHAAAMLAELAQPFTVSEARQALGSSRRVVVPLLEHLDAARVTRRLPDGRRFIVASRG